jgi:hypothetical protein
MSWEKRGHKRYFYRTKKRNGHSVRTYYGSGEITELAATAEALLRVQRQIEDRQRKRELEPLTTAETLLNELCEQSDMLVHASLVAVGYRRENRVHGDAHVNDNLQSKKIENAAREDVARLLEQATNRDVSVSPELRRLLDYSPELWQGYGDLALQARNRWVKLGAGANLLMAECVVQKAAELRTEVAGNSPSPLEQLLADRVVACWLQVSFYDGVVAQTSNSSSARFREFQKLHQRAHRRYLATIKTFATVRKLLTASRSTVETSRELAGEYSALRLRKAPGTDGVSVPG